MACFVLRFGAIDGLPLRNKLFEFVKSEHGRIRNHECHGNGHQNHPPHECDGVHVNPNDHGTECDNQGQDQRQRIAMLTSNISPNTIGMIIMYCSISLSSLDWWTIVTNVILIVEVLALR